MCLSFGFERLDRGAVSRGKEIPIHILFIGACSLFALSSAKASERVWIFADTMSFDLTQRVYTFENALAESTLGVMVAGTQIQVALIRDKAVDWIEVDGNARYVDTSKTPLVASRAEQMPFENGRLEHINSSTQVEGKIPEWQPKSECNWSGSQPDGDALLIVR